VSQHIGATVRRLMAVEAGARAGAGAAPALPSFRPAAQACWSCGSCVNFFECVTAAACRCRRRRLPIVLELSVWSVGAVQAVL
jgi:hypothetical protein